MKNTFNKKFFFGLFFYPFVGLVLIGLVVLLAFALDSISPTQKQTEPIKYDTTPTYVNMGTVKMSKYEKIYYTRSRKAPIVIAQYSHTTPNNSSNCFTSLYSKSKRAEEQIRKFAKDNSLEIFTNFIVATDYQYPSHHCEFISFDNYYILGKKINLNKKNKELSFSNSIYKDSITYDKKHKRIKIKYYPNKQEENPKSIYSHRTSPLLHNMLYDVLGTVLKRGYSIKSISSIEFNDERGIYNDTDDSVYVDIE